MELTIDTISDGTDSPEGDIRRAEKFHTKEGSVFHRRRICRELPLKEPDAWNGLLQNQKTEKVRYDTLSHSIVGEAVVFFSEVHF